MSYLRNGLYYDAKGRECAACNKYKSFSEFAKNKGMRFGITPVCKDCTRERKGAIERKKHIITEEGRECACCGKFKLWESFDKQKAAKTGYKARCRVCNGGKEKRRKKFRTDEYGRECTHCGQFLPWNNFSIRNNTKTGHKSLCKNCVREKQGSKKKKEFIITEEGRECAVCGKFKKWESFHTSTLGVNNHRAQCKKCTNLRSRLYYAENTELFLKKNGAWYSSFSLFGTYGHQLTIDECARETVEGFLEVKCSLCGNYFIPTNREVQNRVQALNGGMTGECRLYCSENCKKQCPIFNKYKYPAGHTPFDKDIRSFPTEFRELVLNRDNHLCVICGSDKDLIVHHIDPFAKCKVFENDIDSACTLCAVCNKRVHSLPGCTYRDLREASQKFKTILKNKGININEIPEWAINKYI
jgi:hypothetical protein